MAVQVKQLLLDSLTNYTSNLIHKAVLEVDGVEKDYDIFRTKIDTGKIIKYVYLDSDENLITKARLVDNARRDLMYNEVNIHKFDDGFMMVFTISIEVKGGVVQ